MKKLITVILLVAVAFAALSQETDDLQEQANQIFEQVSTLYGEANYDEAIALLLENKELFTQAGDVYYASSVSWLGYLYLATVNYAKAESYYLEAKTVYEQTLGKNHSYFIY